LPVLLLTPAGFAEAVSLPHWLLRCNRNARVAGFVPALPAEEGRACETITPADSTGRTRYRAHAAMRNWGGPAGAGPHTGGKNMPFTGEGIIVTLIVGLIAGWLASKIVSGTGLGLIGDIVVGIIGAFIAAWVFPRLGIMLGSGIIREIIDATIGAIILLVVVRLVRGVM
jgi:uncharacterized membrane protein YeaQ/YmgE (transglycosylase-associated protein family)